jgi:hypothetical protein
LPANTNGYVTFGSFNRLSKLGPAVIALGHRLRKVPDAKMLLGGMPPRGQYDELIEWFAREGIGLERLTFHPNCEEEYLPRIASSGRPVPGYFSVHGRDDDRSCVVDGGADVVARWAGLPPGRQSATILAHLGLDGFIAHDAADFEGKGCAWAADLEALARVRAGLRERFERSVVQRPDLICGRAGTCVTHEVAVLVCRYATGGHSNTGDPVSDGAAATPRACPLAVAFAGERAAYLSFVSLYMTCFGRRDRTS